MCMLGEEIERFEGTKENPIIGFRGWFITNPFSDNKKFLKSLNSVFVWNKSMDSTGNIEEIIDGIPLGIYCFDDYNNYNNYYNYYNYYDHYSYYNYYNYSNYYNNYNNYYNNYYIVGTCLQFGKIIKHFQGHRSELAYPKALAVMDNKELIEKFPDYVRHFNSTAELVAKEYNIETIPYSKFEKL